MDVPGGRDPPLGTSALGSQASGAGGGGGGGGKGAPAASLLLLVPHTWLTRSDLALILLAEIAYENDEDFRGHLPLLFHATFILMDCRYGSQGRTPIYSPGSRRRVVGCEGARVLGFEASRLRLCAPSPLPRWAKCAE